MDQNTNVYGLTFYLKNDVNEWLAAKAKEENISNFLIEDGDRFSFDIIDRPIHCLAYAENGDAALELYLRTDTEPSTSPDLSIVIHSDGRKPEINDTGRISGDATSTLLLYTKTASVLRRYSERYGINKTYPQFDPTRDAVIVKYKDDKPIFKPVQRKREEEKPEGFDAVLEAASKGSVSALHVVSDAYLNGRSEDGIEADSEKAYAWMKRLAEEGDSKGMYNLGLFYAKGMGAARNFDKAIDWMKKADQAGDPDAGKAIRQFESIIENEKKAYTGDAQAMADLAASYMALANSLKQAGAKDDYDKSLYWAKRAAGYNNGYGCWILGMLYEHGRGVDKDMGVASRAYQKGAQLGSPEAMNSLGKYYLHGIETEKDSKKAFELFEEAAKQGYGPAMNNLGDCYQFGNGTEASLKRALKLYEQAYNVTGDQEVMQKIQLLRQVGTEVEDWEEEIPEEFDITRETETVQGSVRQALKEQGRPYDDEAIQNLSVEEVYALLGSMEKPDPNPISVAKRSDLILPISQPTSSAPERTYPGYTGQIHIALNTRRQTGKPAPNAQPEVSAQQAAPQPEPAEEAFSFDAALDEALWDALDFDSSIREALGDQDDLMPEQAAPAEETAEPASETVTEPRPQPEPEAAEVKEEAVVEERIPEAVLPKMPALEPVPQETVSEEAPAVREAEEMPAAEEAEAVPAEEHAEAKAEETEDIIEEAEEEPEFKEHITEAEVTARRIVDPVYELYYDNGITGGNDRYTISLPDNFKVLRNEEGRDFIAWLPGADSEDYDSARITFLAGHEAVVNNADTRIFVPEVCGLFAEQLYWQKDAQRILCEKNRIIVMDESHPAGCAAAGYDAGNFMYNISVVLPGVVQTLRVQVLNADEEDIRDCDRMVIDWVKTLRSAVPFETVKEPDDPYFTMRRLSPELAEEWKDAAEVQFKILQEEYRGQTALAALRAQKGVYGDAPEEALQKEVQGSLETWAERYEALLDKGITGAEVIAASNPDNPLLETLYGVLRPAVMGSTKLSLYLDGGYTKYSASIRNIDALRERYTALDPNAGSPKADEEPVLTAFREPEYNTQREITIGRLKGLLPDGMITLADAKPGENNDPAFIEKLKKTYCFAAIPEDWAGGFDNYTDGSFCINVSKPQTMQGEGVLSDPDTEARRRKLLALLTNTLKQNRRFNENYPAEYISGEEDYAVLCAQTEGRTDPLKVGASFVFLIVDQNDLYQGNLYFNSVGEDEQFARAAKTWLWNLYREEAPEAPKYAQADDAEAMHTYLDELGGGDPESGTQTAFVPLTALVDEVSKESDELRKAAAAFAENTPAVFELADTARELAELFRVNRDAFDPARDKEQEIDHGLVRRCKDYSRFRSFAWTLHAYCAAHETAPEDLTIEEIEEIIAYIDNERSGLNYCADSYSPAVCSGDDIDTYYVSDAVPEDVRKTVVRYLKETDPDTNITIASLETLRNELTSLESVMKKIWQKLNAERVWANPLSGPDADLLYVWCSMSYAAGEPMYTGEGPEVCQWTHPEEIVERQNLQEEAYRSAELLEEEDWMTRHAEDLDPDAEILIRDRLFVFDGAGALEDWAALEGRLNAQGAIIRKALSEMTHYLVCNPDHAGESRIREAKELQKNGSEIRIVLLEDVIKALEAAEEEAAAVMIKPLPAETEEEAPAEEKAEAESEAAPAEETAAEASAETESEAAEKPAEEEAEASDPEIAALAYLTEQEKERKEFLASWDKMGKEIAATMVKKVRDGIKQKVVPAEKEGEPDQVMNVPDTTEAKKYIRTIPDQIRTKAEPFMNDLAAFSEQLSGYEGQGLSELTFARLCREFSMWKDAAENLKLSIRSRVMEVTLTDEQRQIGSKWEAVYQNAKEALDQADAEAAKAASKDRTDSEESKDAELTPEEAEKEAQNEADYQKAEDLLKTESATLADLQRAKDLYIKLGEYKDAADKITSCNLEIHNLGQYRIAVRDLEAGTKERLTKAAAIFGTLKHWRDSEAKLAETNQKLDAINEEERKERIYQDAKNEFHTGTIESVKKAISQYEQIPGWNDADDKKTDALNLLKGLEEENARRNEEEQKLKQEMEKKALMIKILLIIVAVLTILVICGAVYYMTRHNKDAGSGSYTADETIVYVDETYPDRL